MTCKDRLTSPILYLLAKAANEKGTMKLELNIEETERLIYALTINSDLWRDDFRDDVEKILEKIKLAKAGK